jgi:hypothetical protein
MLRAPKVSLVMAIAVFATIGLTLPNFIVPYMFETPKASVLKGEILAQTAAAQHYPVAIVGVITAQPPLAVQTTVRAIWCAQELGHRQALDVARTLSMLGTDGKPMADGQQLFRSQRRAEWRLR